MVVRIRRPRKFYETVLDCRELQQRLNQGDFFQILKKVFWMLPFIIQYKQTDIPTYHHTERMRKQQIYFGLHFFIYEQCNN